jgi:UDP-N-acetylglucosamine 1-carboxyvinyltransferase
MNAFEIYGGKPLKGEIVPQGAKNEALQIISAVLLTEEKMTISNIPDIKDVNKLIDLLIALGVDVNRVNGDTYEFEAKNINIDYFQSEEFKKRG